MSTMRLRELGGAIRSAKMVYVYVPYNLTEEEAQEGKEAESTEHGVWLAVPRSTARMVIEDAKEHEIEEITARMERGELFIGDGP